MSSEYKDARLPEYDENAVLPKLSICIATYNRGKLIGETLHSIISQLEPDVELVIVDGASPDNTAEVVSRYCSHHPEIHYYREQENSGVDRDYDKAIGYARGEYCWLMTDDDLLCPGAVQRVLSAVYQKGDLIIVNAQVRTADLTDTLEERRLNQSADRDYGNGELSKFFADTASYISFIGCVVIRRTLWLSRDRSSYYGSLFVHVGVIFQKPSIEYIRVIADPLIIIRYGNAMWTARGFEIWMFKWPQLIWSLPDFAGADKQKVCRREPWRSLKSLLYYRATGAYSGAEFYKYLSGRTCGIARAFAYGAGTFPAALVNFMLVLYFSLLKTAPRVALAPRIALYDLLRSRHATLASRVLARVVAGIRKAPEQCRSPSSPE